jgi:hypothetical protein
MPPPKAAADQWLATDDSNALGLVEAYGERIRYCTDKGRWLAWDGTRWEWQASTGGAAREYAKTWARDLPDGENTSPHGRSGPCPAPAPQPCSSRPPPTPASPSP